MLMPSVSFDRCTHRIKKSERPFQQSNLLGSFMVIVMVWGERKRTTLPRSTSVETRTKQYEDHARTTFSEQQLTRHRFFAERGTIVQPRASAAGFAIGHPVDHAQSS